MLCRCIHFALRIFARSQSVYGALQESGALKLPSKRTLQCYKNYNSAGSGWTKESVLRMVQAFTLNHASEPAGRVGGDGSCNFSKTIFLAGTPDLDSTLVYCDDHFALALDEEPWAIAFFWRHEVMASVRESHKTVCESLETVRESLKTVRESLIKQFANHLKQFANHFKQFANRWKQFANR